MKPRLCAQEAGAWCRPTRKLARQQCTPGEELYTPLKCQPLPTGSMLCCALLCCPPALRVHHTTESHRQSRQHGTSRVVCLSLESFFSSSTHRRHRRR